MTYPDESSFAGTGYTTTISSLRMDALIGAILCPGASCGSAGYPPIAHQLDVRVAPVGQAVVDFHESSIPGFPNVNVLFNSETHLGEKGDYLAALTIAASIFRSLPESVWSLGTVGSWVSAYKAIARDAVVSEADVWNVPLDTQVTRYTNGSSEDAVKRAVGGTVVTTGALAPVASDEVGLRFANVTVPPGATIVSASVDAVRLTTGNFGAYSIAAETLTPQANPPFVDAYDSGDVAGLDFCLLSSCPTLSTVGSYSRLSSLTAGIQGLVDHGAWVSGQSATVVVTWDNWLNVQYKSYDTAPATPPRLLVTYYKDNAFAAP